MGVLERAALARALLVGVDDLTALGPMEIVLEVTSRCNLKCPMCVRTFQCGGRPSLDMPVEHFDRILANLWSGTERVALAGLGEPCLHPELASMVSRLVESGFPVVLYSNATRLTPSLSDALLNAGLSGVVFPVDGHSPEVYEKYRVGADYLVVRDNVLDFIGRRDALGVDCFVEVQMLKLPGTENQINAYRHFWKDAGADAVRYKADHMQDTGSRRSGICPMPWRGPATIDVNGRVFPCCVQDESSVVLGSAIETSIVDLWNGPIARKVRRDFRETRAKLATCKACEIPLPPVPVSAGGSLLSPFAARRILTASERLLNFFSFLGGKK